MPSPVPNRKKKKNALTRRRFLQGAAITAGAVALYEWKEVDRLTLEENMLEVPRWDADGFKIGFISDLHITSEGEGERAVRAAQMAAEQKPDVLLIGGDFVSEGWQHAAEALTEALGKIASLGVPIASVLGNHDYWVEDPLALMTAIRQSGVRLLRNQELEVGGVKIMGVDDGVAGKDRHDWYGPAGDKNTVTLFHEPDFVTRTDKRASLMIAGHSHGGQVCIGGTYRRFLPRGARKYIEGHYPNAEVPLYVSRGVGTVGPKVRAFCPPEVTILTLRGRGA